MAIANLVFIRYMQTIALSHVLGLAYLVKEYGIKNVNVLK